MKYRGHTIERERDGSFYIYVDGNAFATTGPFKSVEEAKARIDQREPGYVDTCIEHAYGTTQRLSFQIRVF